MLQRESFRVRMNILLSLIFLIGAVIEFKAPIVSAQEVAGSIKGVVKDQNGAVVAGATITAVNQQRNYTTATDQDGIYSFVSLPPGSYIVTATASGFGTIELDNVSVELGRAISVNLELQVGAIGETINITSSQEPIVDLSSSKTSVNITEQQIAVLPKTLNFSSVLEVAPGTRSEDKAGGFQIDGASGSENVFVVDGVEVTELVSGTLGLTKNIPLDFIQEVQVKSAGYEAEFGGATGGVINLVTKSGSNDYHGEARLEYTSDRFRAEDNPILRLDRLDPEQQTIDYFKNPQGKDESRLLNPTFTLGGPVIKNRLWFFTSYAPQFNRMVRRLDLIKEIEAGDSAIQTIDSRFVKNGVKIDYLLARLDWAPTSKISIYGNFINSPIKTDGTGVPFQTSSNFTFSNPRYRFQGGYTPSSQVAFGANWIVTPNLVLSFRGGHSYLNDKGGSYDIPVNTPLVFISAPCTLPGCAPGTTTIGAPVIQNNFLTQINKTGRTNLNFDATYITRIFGRQHVFKGGYQANLLGNEIESGSSGGEFEFFFNRNFEGERGRFGFYTISDFTQTGKVSSSNQGFFIQDSWSIHPRVTLNLGLRLEKEFLPSFKIRLDFHPDIPPDVAANTPKRPIDFGYGDKVAPRLGAAWDVLGNGRLKLSGSFSIFYDTMKYSLTRSFGSDKFLFTVRKLEQPDFRGITLANQPGEIIFGPADFRFPTNVTLPGERPNIDPDLKPFRLREYSATFDYALRADLILSLRFTRKEVDRAIEDVGGTDAKGNEIFTIGNPGFGATVKFFNPPTPRAVRDYTGLELRLDKRFSKNWYANISYVYSKLFGNYSGLASSDEVFDGGGRTDPNVNRFFDLPESNFDTRGRPILGRLATDRPHTFKAFAAYRFGYKLGGRAMETEVGGSQLLFQGTPITTVLDVNVGESGGIDIFPEGRGDLGRTPVFSETDLVVNHFIAINERVKFKFSLNVFNLFDERNTTDIFSRLLGPGQSVGYEDLKDYLNANGDFRQRIRDQQLVLDPRFGLPSDFQSPRRARFSFAIQF
jgi:hypothetical protein